MSPSLILLPVLGFAAGVVTGMGIGGGAILIPCLIIFAGMSQRDAQCVNLLYFIPTAVIAVIAHIKNKKINASLVKGIVFYGLAGSAAGAFLALSIRQEALRTFFGGFLILVGVYEFVKAGQNNEKQRNND